MEEKNEAGKEGSEKRKEGEKKQKRPKKGENKIKSANLKGTERYGVHTHACVEKKGESE